MTNPDRSRRLPHALSSRWRTGGIVLAALVLLGWPGTARAQQTRALVPLATPAPPPQKSGFFLFRAPQKPITQNIPAQEPAKVSVRLSETPPDDARVIVSLTRQRVWLMYGDDVIIDSPISSGKRGHSTPTGKFKVMEKDANHYSSIYGNFVDSKDRIVRSGVSARIDSAPSGTHFKGAPMRWFMRLTSGGVGMHVGILPGYPASHGCVRLPPDVAELIYKRVKVGTPVAVEP